MYGSQEAITKGAEIFMGRSQYGARATQVSLAVSQTATVALGDVLESGKWFLCRQTASLDR